MRPLRVAGALVLAVVATAVLFLVVNQFDEDLPPEVAAFYASGAMPPLEARSGYALLSGLSAPVDQDPRDWAIAWSRSVQEAARTRQPFPERKGTLKVQGAAELLCQPEKGDCVELYGRNPKAVTEMALDNALLLKRYSELQAQTDVADAGIPTAITSPVADYSVIVDTHLLFLSQVAVQAAAGDLVDALGRLAADASFQRRCLAQGRTIIPKMVAVRSLGRDLLLATQIARRVPETPSAHWHALKGVTKPLDRTELALPVRFESAALRDLVERVRVMDRGRLRSEMGISPIEVDLMTLMLSNATLRFAHRHFALWEQLDEVESRDIEARIASVKEQTRELHEPDWTWFYNPAGKSIVATGAIDFSPYVLRIRDVDALARLACATISIRQHRISPDGVAEHLAKSEPGCGDPYTGRPMAWDSAKGQLWFAPRWPGSAERFGGGAGRIAIAPY